MIYSCACVKGGFNVAIEQINAAIEHPGVIILLKNFLCTPGWFLQPIQSILWEYQLLAVASMAKDYSN